MDDPRCWTDLAEENERLRKLLAALVDRDCSYHGNEIRIPCDSHGDAIGRVAAARAAIGETHAQEPFDHEGGKS